MTFNALSKAQKKFVLIAQETGKLGPGSTITLKEVQRIYDESKIKRSAGGTRIGFPTWIINDKFKVSRGVYKLPIPSDQEVVEYQQELEFKTRIAENGFNQDGTADDGAQRNGEPR